MLDYTSYMLMNCMFFVSGIQFEHVPLSCIAAFWKGYLAVVQTTVGQSIRLVGDRGACMPMTRFWHAYEKIILNRHGDVLDDAYARALGQSSGVADHNLNGWRSLHTQHMVPKIIFPIVNEYIRRGLHTPNQLYVLLQLFTPTTNRFIQEVDKPVYQKATTTNEKAWKEIRNLLFKHSALSDYVDWSLDKAYWQPLVSHLAREAILWAYVAAVCLPDDPLPLELVPQTEPRNATDGDDDPVWGPVTEMLMERLRVDIRRRTLPHDGREGTSEVEPSIKGLRLADLISAPSFESPYASKDVSHLRFFISKTYDDQMNAEDAFSQQLARFDFSRRLLLYFAYTAYTHLRLSTPDGDNGDVNPIRGAIIEALTQLDFHRIGDADLGDALGWLSSISDRGQHFGDTFDRRLRTALLRAFDGEKDDEVVSRCRIVILVIQDLLAYAPWLKTSQWLRTLEPWDEYDFNCYSLIESEDFDKTLQKHINQDNLEIFQRSRVERSSPPVEISTLIILEDIDLSKQDQEHIHLLDELTLANQEFRTYYHLSSQTPQRVRKYFTALCHGRDKGKGPNVETVMTVEQWFAVTEELCAAPSDQILTHYANVWQRLSRLPVPASEASNDLHALQPYLRPVPGLPSPGE